MGTKKILIINTKQFGHHTDSYKISLNLTKRKHRVTYLCFDQGLAKITVPDVQIIYIEKKSYFYDYFSFIKLAINLSKEHDVAHVVYFKFCVFLCLINNVVLDIRTLSVNKSAVKRMVLDTVLKFESLFFSKIIAISDGIARKLPKNKRVKVIGLAADTISDNDKDFSFLRLLYVGTLENRRIEVTVEGLSLFLKRNKTSISIQYTIVGSGPTLETLKIFEAIKKNNLEDIVRVVGHVPVDKLQMYFETSNIGISFIPITAFYNHQPPTKTYEYIKSGLFTLASKTRANQDIINEANGVLINDTIQDFATGIEKIVNKLPEINSPNVRETLKNVDWMTITTNFEQAYFEKC